jgi:hypothetical protein
MRFRLPQESRVSCFHRRLALETHGDRGNLERVAHPEGRPRLQPYATRSAGQPKAAAKIGPTATFRNDGLTQRRLISDFTGKISYKKSENLPIKRRPAAFALSLSLSLSLSRAGVFMIKKYRLAVVRGVRRTVHSVPLAALITTIWVLNTVPLRGTIESNSGGATCACPVASDARESWC